MRWPVILVAVSLLLVPRAGAQEEKPDWEWPTFGGSPARNMVNTVAKNLPVTWSIEEGSKVIKWVADLGSKAYGGPSIAGEPRRGSVLKQKAWSDLEIECACLAAHRPALDTRHSTRPTRDTSVSF